MAVRSGANTQIRSGVIVLRMLTAGLSSHFSAYLKDPAQKTINVKHDKLTNHPVPNMNELIFEQYHI